MARVGFTIRCEGSGSEFQIYAPKKAVWPVLDFTKSGTISVAFLGRLYYRNDLVARLPAALRKAAVASDARSSALIANLYRHSGMAGLLSLEGDFALALTDSSLRQVYAVRDPLGGYPLYWARSASAFLLSTSLLELVHLLPSCSLNCEYFADFLMSPGGIWEEMQQEHTVYRNVWRVIAGGWLRADLNNGEIKTGRYWDWLTRLVDPGTDRLDEIGQRFGHLLEESVRERMIGRTMCHLSGGFDSAAVTVMANSAIEGNRASGPLHAVSLVYENLKYLARERQYITSVLDAHSTIVPHFVDADNFCAFQNAPYHEEPWPALFWSEPETALLDAASDAEADTVLSGLGADEQVDPEPYHLTEWIRAGKWRRAWRESARWARESSCNRWTILYPYGIANCIPICLRDGLKPLLKGGYSHWGNQGHTTIPPWVRPEFARQHQMHSRGYDTVRRMFHACTPTQLSLALFGVNCRCGDLSRWNLGLPRNIHEAHPFLDPRVLCFGLGMQLRVRAEPGVPKPVLVSALGDRLPKKIRDRLWTGHFNEYLFLGLSRRKNWLENVIREAHIDELGIIDKGLLLNYLQGAAFGIGRDARVLDRLNLTLSLILWFCQRASKSDSDSPPTHFLAINSSERPSNLK